MKPRVKYAGRPFEPAWRVDHDGGTYWTPDWQEAVAVALCNEQAWKSPGCIGRQACHVGWPAPAEGGAAA